MQVEISKREQDLLSAQVYLSHILLEIKIILTNIINYFIYTIIIRI